MARVQIPAGAFFERSEENRPEGFEPESEANGVSETTVVQIPAGAVLKPSTLGFLRKQQNTEKTDESCLLGFLLVE